MTTQHRIIRGNSNNMDLIEDKSVDLILTSPPYPMIEMWDPIFGSINEDICEDIKKGNGNAAFNKMHDILNKTWKECDRVLKENGFACINIGDATRTINKEFNLFSNHTAVINYFISMGYTVLPDIHWRKTTNAPNKYMGSGMLPAGAYVTYEHEYILVFRKGGKRVFNKKEIELRQESAYFWEERNVWFSDIWDIKGTSQVIANSKTRDRNASFPLELPYRIINMYSCKGDTVIDPFNGMGTTNLAAILCGRNSVGYDIDPEFIRLAFDNIPADPSAFNNLINKRCEKHNEFINNLPADKLDKCYDNKIMNIKVKTMQEKKIKFSKIIELTKNYDDNNNVVVTCHYK